MAKKKKNVIPKKEKIVRKRRKKKSKESNKYMSIDTVYEIINKVQINRKENNLIISLADSFFIENILKDCEMKYERKNQNDTVLYKIYPPPQREIPEDFYVFNEEYEDEIKEDGQCF